MNKIVFFGTPHFAATILEELLHKKFNIIACVTKPDKEQGRSLISQPPPVKKLALAHNIPVHQPLKASSDEFIKILTELNADLFVVVAYSEIFKENLLNLPPLGCINVHASLLPKYRGAAPIHRAVMNGDEVSGVTIMRMRKQLDAGEIFAVEKTPITADMTTGELFVALAKLGGKALQKVLLDFEKGDVEALEQDPALVTYAPKVTSAEAEVDWRRDAKDLHNHIRGLTPKPGAWCWIEMRGKLKRLLIKKTATVALQGKPGEILRENGLIVACQKNALNLLEIQLEGKKAMPAAEFLKGVLIQELSFPLKK